jgi:hypothetical protein
MREEMSDVEARLERLEKAMAGSSEVWTVEDFRKYRNLCSMTKRQMRVTMLVRAGGSMKAVTEAIGRWVAAGGDGESRGKGSNVGATKQSMRMCWQKMGGTHRRVLLNYEDLLERKMSDEHFEDMFGFSKTWASDQVENLEC